ncbi:MAG: DNA repair protein RadC [Nitrospirae bacterium]|nr:DNA repair protein RadC [Nitrospirota bacterium]
MEVRTRHRGQKVSDPNKLAEVMSSILRGEDDIDRDKEHFWVIGLSVKLSILYIELVSLGTLTSALIHPRETFRRAIAKGAASIACVHNHPSGDLEPSSDDLKVTEKLRDAGEIVGIKLIDHIIIANDGGFMSIKERGIL